MYCQQTRLRYSPQRTQHTCAGTGVLFIDLRNCWAPSAQGKSTAGGEGLFEHASQVRRWKEHPVLQEVLHGSASDHLAPHSPRIATPRVEATACELL
jgi:hypothetical protein